MLMHWAHIKGAFRFLFTFHEAKTESKDGDTVSEREPQFETRRRRREPADVGEACVPRTIRTRIRTHTHTFIYTFKHLKALRYKYNKIDNRAKSVCACHGLRCRRNYRSKWYLTFLENRLLLRTRSYAPTVESGL